MPDSGYIRKAALEDSALVADLIYALLNDFNERNGGSFSIDKEKLKASAELLIPRPSYAAFILYYNSDVAGIITITPCAAIYNGGDFGVITELYVKPEFRSKEIGKTLLVQARLFAVEQRWKKLEVGAPDATLWPRTIEFYKKNGFKEKGPKLRLDL